MVGTPKAVVPSATDRIFAEVRPFGPVRIASFHIDPQTSNPERADGHPTYSINWNDSRDCHAIVIQVPNFSQSSASKDPTNAACVVHASFPKGFQVSYMHTRTVSGCNWPSVCVLDGDLEWPCTSGPSNPLGQSPPCVPEESSDQSIRRSRMMVLYRGMPWTWWDTAKNFRVLPLPLRCRRAVDAGIWNGLSYEDVPATTIPT